MVDGDETLGIEYRRTFAKDWKSREIRRMEYNGSVWCLECRIVRNMMQIGIWYKRSLVEKFGGSEEVRPCRNDVLGIWLVRW